MAYQAPYIDESGIHISSYEDIRDSLVEEMKSIFGQDIYLDNDSQDYQMISAFALKAYDVQQALILVYNNNSPKTAIGTGLDRVVALNGITRNAATYSTCVVKLTGDPNTVINNGKVKDERGFIWSLPQQVKIGVSGTTLATAKCTALGRITAAPGDISSIETPTKGWVSVTNEDSATPGLDQETNSELRQKQQLSVANPSRSIFQGIFGAVANIKDVVRHASYENDTNQTVDILPPNSITLVVEGGNGQEIATVIHKHKTPGCYTNGDVVVNIDNGYGVTTPIRFYRPSYVDLEVSITVKKLTGYTDAVTQQIKENVYNYINGFGIGVNLYTPNINGPILSILSGQPSFYVTALTAKKKGQASAEEITVSKIEAVRIALLDITVEVVA